MLRVFSAASGDELASFSGNEWDGALTVASLKSLLARESFRSCSRFQLRLFREGEKSELKEDEAIVGPMDVQLMIMSHLAPDRERDHSFWSSCQHGTAEEVGNRLQALQNPNIDVRDGSPLCLAAQSGNLEVVRLLLEAAADTEWQDKLNGMRALHCATEEGHDRSEVVHLLLSARADQEAQDFNGDRATHRAAMNGHEQVIRHLLEFRADMEAANCHG